MNSSEKIYEFIYKIYEFIYSMNSSVNDFINFEKKLTLFEGLNYVPNISTCSEHHQQLAECYCFLQYIYCFYI
jgi:hypothetical protein